MKKVLPITLAMFLIAFCATLAAAQNGDYLALYRLFNARSGDHLYTTRCQEKEDLLRTNEWAYEGVQGYVSSRSRNKTWPLYRLHLANGEHFYTVDGNEAASLAQQPGNQNEGVAGYVADRKQNDTKPFYRLYDGKMHFYTTDENERDTYQRTGGRLEGQAGWLYTRGVNACDYGYMPGGAGGAPVFYSGTNFDGPAVSVENEWRDNSDWDGSPNTIRSVRVPQGWYLIVYSKKNFGGRSSVISSSITLGPGDEWYNKIKSVKAVRGVPPIR